MEQMPLIRDSTKGKINKCELSLQPSIMNIFLRILPIVTISSYTCTTSAQVKMHISYIGVLYLNDNYLMFLISVCT